MSFEYLHSGEIKMGEIKEERRGQVSLELMMYTFLSLLLFTTYFLFISNYIKQDAMQSKEEAAQNLIYNIAEDINLVYLLGKGYHLNITLPERLANNLYSIHIEGNKVILSYYPPSTSYIQSLLFNSTSLSLQPGRINEIYNKKGEIKVRVY